MDKGTFWSLLCPADKLCPCTRLKTLTVDTSPATVSCSPALCTSAARARVSQGRGMGSDTDGPPCRAQEAAGEALHSAALGAGPSRPGLGTPSRAARRERKGP